jgi:hypothetical protein
MHLGRRWLGGWSFPCDEPAIMPHVCPILASIANRMRPLSVFVLARVLAGVLGAVLMTPIANSTVADLQ